MANAESVPAKKPAVDHAASTEPCETAWIASRRRDQRAGLVDLDLDRPARGTLSFSANLGAASPRSVRLVGNTLAMLSWTVCAACACAGAACSEGVRSPQAFAPVLVQPREDLLAHARVPEALEVSGDTLQGGCAIGVGLEEGPDLIGHVDEVVRVHLSYEGVRREA